MTAALVLINILLFLIMRYLRTIARNQGVMNAYAAEYAKSIVTAIRKGTS